MVSGVEGVSLVQHFTVHRDHRVLVPLLMAQRFPDDPAHLGTSALDSHATHAIAAPAYNSGYFLTVGGLACTVLVLAALTAWCLRNNPKSGTPSTS